MNMFIAQINLLSFSAFFMIEASIVLRQYFLQKIWNYTNLNGEVTRRRILIPVTVHAKFQTISINRIGEIFYKHLSHVYSMQVQTCV